MGNLLASDANNTEFTGAHNPDQRLAVRFYLRAVQNEFESNRQGRPIFEDRDYIEIMVPGDNTTKIDTAVREDHKQRFPLQWAHYQNRHSGDQREVGTPLSAWPRLSVGQVEEMKALKFFTVESVANATDQGLQKLGMVAGMSPYTFREHAQRFLKVAREDAIAAEAEAKVKALEEQNAALRAETEVKLAEIQKNVAEQVANAVASALAAERAPKKRGPKPKTQAPADPA